MNSFNWTTSMYSMYREPGVTYLSTMLFSISPLIQIDSSIEIQHHIAVFFTLQKKKKTPLHVTWLQTIPHLTSTQISSCYRYHTHASAESRRRGGKKLIMCTRWRITRTPLIWPTAVCTVQITYQWQLSEVKWQFSFDRATFVISIWITLWMHQMKFLKREIEREREKNQGQNTFELNLKVALLLAHNALQFTVSLFKVKMKIGAWSICIWTKRGRQIMNVENVISITLSLFFY